VKNEKIENKEDRRVRRGSFADTENSEGFANTGLR